MKHRFLLDENILYLAIYGVDAQGRSDSAATDLVRRIGANCHTIVLNNLLRDRYWVPITAALRENRRPKALEPIAFIVQLQMNSLKWWLELDDCPRIPEGALIPAEDVHIVRLALLSQAKIVTADSELRIAVNRSGGLGVQAITPGEALILSLDS